MFVELLSLKDKKNLKHEIDKISNVKMIHNKVESGKDGKPVMDIKVAKKYNDAIKEELVYYGKKDNINLNTIISLKISRGI